MDKIRQKEKGGKEKRRERRKDRRMEGRKKGGKEGMKEENLKMGSLTCENKPKMDCCYITQR